ncbi:hypothetical protein PMAYCL1PPCAC_08988, partial [Pristionchus mayeri]
IWRRAYNWRDRSKESTLSTMIAQLSLLSTLLLPAFAQQYPYAVDIAQQGPSSVFSCLKSNSYSTVFLRVYKPDGSGAVDTAGINNISPAFYAGLGTEVYMTPNPTSSKSANSQVDELVKTFKTGGVQVRSLWLQVTSPLNWNKDQIKNINFIQAVIARFRTNGITTGIYTNNYDWQQITNNAVGLGTDVRLWYWSVLGQGPTGETAPNFTDFRPFGQWSSAAVKQFAQNESVCGQILNRDVYMLNAASSALRANRVDGTALETEKSVVVGSIGL